MDTGKSEDSFKVFKPHLEDERVNLVEQLPSKMVIDPFTEEEYKAQVYKVTGKRLEQIVTMTNIYNREARERVYDVLGKMNVYRELRRQGIELGDVIEIAGKEFFYRGD
jgi:Obg family GTPase CgtA-like protein